MADIKQYTTRQEIYVTVDVGNFQIFDAGWGITLYNGIAFNPTGAATVTLDIAPILRQFVDMPDYRPLLDNRTGAADSMGALEIEVNNGAGKTYDYFMLRWDYSDKPLPVGLYGGGVQDYVYAGQPLPINARPLVDGTESYNVLVYAYAAPDACDVGGCAKYINVSSTIGGERVYKIRDCVPDHAVTLFFVDKQGALSWVHCDRKVTAQQNITRAQLTHTSKVTETTHFGIDNYRVDAYKSYTLLTGYLSDAESRRLQDLFTSPRVWMYDYETDTFTSVVMTDTEQTIKNKRNSGTLFNYSIKCRQSQTEQIIA